MKKIGYISVALALLCCCNGNAKSETGDTSANSPEINSGITVEDSASNASADGEEESDEGTAGNSQSSQSTISNNGQINGAERLKAAYPQMIKDIKDNKIIFADGTTMVYDDGKEKDFVTMLDYADPEDMFKQAYNTSSTTPGYLEDVGRSRSEELFKKLYGNSSAAVGKQLVTVDWFGQKLKFSSNNGAAEQLKKVKKELEQHPELKKYLKSAGTFYWRPVRGAKRLSAHSYGIAIDVGVDNSDYWLWQNPGASETKKISYKNRMPMKLVEIFEKYGFVWGGRWYHFDTMHFEYRPELNPPRN